MKVIMKKIGEIKPYEKNPRHNDEAVELVKNSIEKFGWKVPIVVDKKGVIIAGHTRYKAALQMGIDEVPVVVADDLNAKQAKAYRLADNKVGEAAEWDGGLLRNELEGLVDDFNLSDFGFEMESDWFENREKDTGHQEGNEEYNDFIDKFEIKKTTDDCYTPELVYDAIADFVATKYGLDKNDFVRPFYPGGDYKSFIYPKNCVVVDNPPFSIGAEIREFYFERNIKFFLFAPGLTMFSGFNKDIKCCYICTYASITYENGAVVNTSFVTNLEEDGIVAKSCPELNETIVEANKKNQEKEKIELPAYEYPPNVITASMINKLSLRGIEFQLKAEDVEFIRELDSQKAQEKGIFGSGFLVSDCKAEEAKLKAEEAKREKTQVWELSDREREIIDKLNKQSSGVTP